MRILSKAALKGFLGLGFALSIGSLAMLPEAHAEKTGNGGGAYICPDPSQSEMLDLFEAKIPGLVSPTGLTIKTSNLPVEEQIQNAFNRVRSNQETYDLLIKAYAVVKSATRIPVPNGYDLAWPSDAKNKYGKKNCSGKAVMLFHDNDHTVDFDALTLETLPNTSQAAAWVHETVYLLMRTRGAEDSVSSRLMVGYLFSDEPDQVVVRKLFNWGLVPSEPPLGDADPLHRTDYERWTDNWESSDRVAKYEDFPIQDASCWIATATAPKWFNISAEFWPAGGANGDQGIGPMGIIFQIGLSSESYDATNFVTASDFVIRTSVVLTTGTTPMKISVFFRRVANQLYFVGENIPDGGSILVPGSGQRVLSGMCWGSMKL